MPSGTLVEELCGQPEQKCGVRVATSLVVDEHLLRMAKPRHAAAQVVVVVIGEQALADGDGDVVGIERALHREEPAALLVLLADADRLVGGAVELLAQLHLDEGALLLDHDDLVEAAREIHQLALRRAATGRRPCRGAGPCRWP